MLLCDRIAQAPAVSAKDDSVVTTALPVGGSALARLVQSCPVRYVMNDLAYDQCWRVAREQADCVVASLRDLRIGHGVMWLEWLEPRETNPTIRQRAGVLVEADAEGRSGTISSAWMDDGDGPFRGPTFFAFNFDEEISKGLSAYNVNSRDRDLYLAYDRLFRHTDFCVDSHWLDRLKRSAASADVVHAGVHRLFQASLRDFPLLCAFLLMSSFPRIFESRPSDLSRLNRARTWKGGPALLDHVEVLMRFDGVRTGACGGALRDGPRLHLVRGHLMHRDGKVFWRRSHFRGDAGRGAIVSKTVRVRDFVRRR